MTIVKKAEKFGFDFRGKMNDRFGLVRVYVRK